jgi:serine/threonine-protein kinase
LSRGTSPLASLVATLADGWPLDWSAIEESASDERTRQAVRGLKTVAAIASFHRDGVPTRSRRPPSAQGTPTTQASAPTSQSRPGPTPPGSGRWGRFRLLSLLGQGGYGEIYRALDTQLDREVALKLLKPSRTSLDLTRRLLDEARMLAQVRHPNVAAVYGAAEQEGRAGFWMELIHGVTLEDLLRLRGPQSASEAALVGRDLCRALAAVHGAGLVHGDVKTSNVMRETGGRIVLMDFGAGASQGRSSGGSVMGTPLYTAPELHAGERPSVSSDIYSLGVLLFRLATSAYPRRVGRFGDLAEAHAAGPPLSLRDLRPELPDAFVSAVERAIAQAPGERPRSAGSLQALLGVVLGVPLP